MLKKAKNEPSSRANYDALDVTSTATKIINGNRKRLSIVIQNQGTTALYLGYDNAVTTSEFATSLQAGTAKRDGKGAAWADSGYNEVYEGTVWGIRVSGGTGLASYSEVIDKN